MQRVHRVAVVERATKENRVLRAQAVLRVHRVAVAVTEIVVIRVHRVA